MSEIKDSVVVISVMPEDFDIVVSDERFSQPLVNESKAMGEDFKKKIRKEESRSKRSELFHKLKPKLSNAFVVGLKVADFILNAYVVGAIMITIGLAIVFIVQEKIYISLVCCALVIVLGWLNDKIG